MATELVAWSTIHAGAKASKDEPGEVKVIKPGETVTQADLGVDDDEMKQLIEGGSVRTMKFPDMPNTYQDSPVNFLREQANKAASGTLLEAENSEENIAAIIAANAASTGGPMTAEALTEEQQEEMDKQLADQGGDTKATPESGQQVSKE